MEKKKNYPRTHEVETWMVPYPSPTLFLRIRSKLLVKRLVILYSKRNSFDEHTPEFRFDQYVLWKAQYIKFKNLHGWGKKL